MVAVGASTAAELREIRADLCILGVLALHAKVGVSVLDRTFARAAEIVQALAGTMEDLQQRSSFLSAPLVKRVLEHVRLLE